MAMRVLASILLAFGLPSAAYRSQLKEGEGASPISKVIEMVEDLQAKIIKEGDATQKVYEEFAEWCEDRSKELGFEIKTGKATVKELTATIDDASANIAALAEKVEKLADSIKVNEEDLEAATKIREKEAADFATEDKELVEVLDMLGRAHGIIEKEMGGASMLQLQNAGSLAEALKVMVQAHSINSADASKLTALVQSSTSEDDEELGAPAGKVTENQSGGILDTLASLMDKAENELEKARAEETKAQNDFAMLKQSLTDEIKFAKKDMDAAKKESAENEETKAKAEGDLSVTSKDLKEDTAALSDLHHDCMTKAQEFEEETRSRGEELAALAKAKQIIIEATSLSQVSLLQRSRSRMSTHLGQFEAVRFVRDLARKHGSKSLAQLASRMEVASRSSANGDVFAKIKGLINDMIQKLEDEAGEDAEKKAFCDKELGESNAKHEDKTADIEKLTAKIDQMTAKSAKLQEEVATLQKELAEIAASQKEMDKLREEENAVYVESKAVLEKGLNGIKLALKVLRDYYSKDAAHGSAGGASTGIIGLLEVCEADFSKELGEVNMVEQTAVSAYEQETKDNELETTTKSQDVKYKTKESADLDKAVAEATNDRSTVQEELDAVNEYLEKLHQKCDEKVESYAEKKKRREAEIAGLKEALTILEDETALIQKSSRRYLRIHTK